MVFALLLKVLVRAPLVVPDIHPHIVTVDFHHQASSQASSVIFDGLVVHHELVVETVGGPQVVVGVDDLAGL